MNRYNLFINPNILLTALICASLLGCTYSRSRYYEDQFISIEQSPLDINHEVKAYLRAPISALFIGVSNYDREAGVQPTMAPTISASIMFSFLRELNRSKDSSIDLVADLRAHPIKDSPMLLDFHGAFLDRDIINSYYPGRSKLNEDGTFSYVGKGKPVTKERIMNSLETTLTSYKNFVTSNDQEMVLFIYISAHGTIADENLYIIPSNGRIDDPETLLTYREVLSEIYETQASLIFDEKLTAEPHVIVIIDACQNYMNGNSGENHDEAVTLPAPTPDTSVLLSSSPGQYAFHWKNNRRIVDSTITKDRQIYHDNNDHDSKEYIHDFDTSISTIPVATISGINQTFEQYEKNIGFWNDAKAVLLEKKKSSHPMEFMFHLSRFHIEYRETFIKLNPENGQFFISKYNFLKIIEEATKDFTDQISQDAPIDIIQTTTRFENPLSVDTDFIIIEN